MVENPKLQLLGHTRNQYFAAISANLLVLGYGCGLSWLAQAIPLLISPDTPLSSGPMRIEQISSAMAMHPLGSMIGSLLFGYLASRLGTKRSMLALVIPQVISCLFLLFAGFVECIMISNFFTGIVGGGAQICFLLYFAEIANRNIRGKLSTTFKVSQNLGFLLTYIISIYTNSFNIESLIFLGISILFAISYIGLPATPQHLLKIGKVDNAKAALKFYNGIPKGELNAKFNQTFERLQCTTNELEKDSSLKWKDIAEPAARNGIMTGIVLVFLSQSCGFNIYYFFFSSFLNRSGWDVSGRVAGIVLVSLNIAGALLATQLVDRLGRKCLLVVSLVGCTVGLCTTATYFYCSISGYEMSMFTWVPIMSMGFSSFMATLGIIPVPMICLVELLPAKVRTFGLTIGSISMEIFSYLSVKSFLGMANVTGMESHCSFLVSAVICVFGIFFVIFFVKETKGKVLELPNDENLRNTQENAGPNVADAERIL